MAEYKFDITVTIEAEDADDANERLTDWYDTVPEGVEVSQTAAYSNNPE